MMKLTIAVYIFLMFFLTVAQPAKAQGFYDPAEYVEWSEHNKLTWDMFAGAPDPTSFGDAGTAVKIQAKPYFAGKDIHYHVHALFSMKRSWCKQKSPELLAHEQLHFDIAELTARLVRKKIALLNKADVDDIDIYNQAIEKILLESNNFDAAYDQETFHGIISDKQEEWQEEVRQELKRLDSYKDTKAFMQSAY